MIFISSHLVIDKAAHRKYNYHVFLSAERGLNMSKHAAHSASVSGICAALAIVLLFCGTMIPVGTYCSPMLASLLILPVYDIGGKQLGFCWYLVVSFLSFLLLTDREAVLLYTALGYYPLLKSLLDSMHSRVLRLFSKMIVFSFALFFIHAGLRLLGLPSLVEEYRSSPFLVVIAAVFILAAALTFLLYDNLLSSLLPLWKRKRKQLLHF